MILVEGGLASDLVADDKRAQLTFLVGRFVGALKAKHLRLTPLQVAVAGIKSLKFLNVFIRPYERTIVYWVTRSGSPAPAASAPDSASSAVCLSAKRSLPN